MDEQEKDIIVDNVEEEVVNTPSDEVVEEVDATSELPETAEVDDKPEEVEDAEGEGEEAGADIPEEDKQEKEEVKEEGKGEEKLDTTSSNEPSVQEATKDIEEVPPENVDTPSLEELQTKIAELEYERETQKLEADFSESVSKQQKEFEEFSNALRNKVNEEITRYGIPMDANPEELKVSDPAKYQILENILTNAERIADQVKADLQAPIKQASDNIIFREAGAAISKYNLTQEQQVEACKTFLNIFNETGLKDLKDDLLAKVELAVARAKLIHKDVQTVKKDVVKTVEDVKEAIVDVKEAKAEEEPKPKEEGKKLEDFTEDITPGAVAKGAEISKDNVMKIYLSKTGKERLEFFAKHKDLIMENLSKTGMNYSDSTRRW